MRGNKERGGVEEKGEMVFFSLTSSPGASLIELLLLLGCSFIYTHLYLFRLTLALRWSQPITYALLTRTVDPSWLRTPPLLLFLFPSLLFLPSFCILPLHLLLLSPPFHFILLLASPLSSSNCLMPYHLLFLLFPFFLHLSPLSFPFLSFSLLSFFPCPTLLVGLEVFYCKAVRLYWR